MKQILSLALALCMIVALFAVAPTVACADDQTVLTMWCIATESDANRPAYEAAIAEFEAAHPDIKIEWEAFENQSYKTKIKAAMSDPETLPDSSSPGPAPSWATSSRPARSTAWTTPTCPSPTLCPRSCCRTPATADITTPFL